MSSERLQSPVWDDVMRVWTDPVDIAEAGLREGRGRAEWWRVLVIYALALAFSLVIASKLGTDKLVDHFTGVSDPATDGDSISPWVMPSLIGAVTVWLTIWWSVMPAISGWFGGSRLRKDTNLSLYFSFCVGFLTFFVGALTDIVSVLLQWIAYPAGSWFHLGVLVLMIAIPWHQFARVAQRVLFLPTYWRAFSMITISAFLTLILALVLAAGIGLAALYFYPTLLDPPQ